MLRTDLSAAGDVLLLILAASCCSSAQLDVLIRYAKILLAIFLKIDTAGTHP